MFKLKVLTIEIGLKNPRKVILIGKNKFKDVRNQVKNQNTYTQILCLP